MSDVAIFGTVSPALAERLQEGFNALVVPAGDERAAWLAEHGDKVRVAVVTYTDGMTRDLADQLPRLEAVASFGVGYDGSDLDALGERGIPLANTPDVLTECVADTAVGLALDTMRQLSAADRFVRAGRWHDGAYPLTTRLWGTPVGVLGLGRIGKAIARRLEGFGCPIAYYQRHEDPTVSYRYVDNSRQLAEDVRLLIVAVPGGDSTRDLVDADLLAALGSDGFLINIARGSVVNEEALVQALEDGVIAGAGLDVFRDEPHVPAALLERDDVVLLPHVGSGTVETRADMADLLLANIDAWLKRRELITPVR